MRRSTFLALVALAAACTGTGPAPGPAPTPSGTTATSAPTTAGPVSTSTPLPVEPDTSGRDRELLDRWAPWLVSMRSALDHLHDFGCAHAALRISTMPVDGFADGLLADAARRIERSAHQLGEACSADDGDGLEAAAAELREAISALAQRATVFAPVDPE